MHPSTSASVRFRGVLDAEYEAALRLIDEAFRSPAGASLRQTFPTALGRNNRTHLYVGEANGQLVCAAAALLRDWVTSQGVLRTACLGSFATRPTMAGQGYSSALQEWMLARARQDGAAWAVLFTDQPWLYAGRGFMPVGRERFGTLAHVAWPPIPTRAAARAATADDAAQMLSLYEQHPLRAMRPLADLRAHLSAGGSRVEVLEVDGQVLAYAATGKGADFTATVCEYAGEVDAVHALWGRAAASGAGQVLVPSGADRYLAGAGTHMPLRSRSSALARVLDPRALPGGAAHVTFAAWGFDSA